MLAANLVGPDLGFDVDENALLVVWEGGELHIEKDTKYRVAVRLVEQIAGRYQASPHDKHTESHAEHSA
jgi:phosphopantothenoylcysteine decarboxylase/phosphopantothenate--cysteine ligase